MMTQAWDDAYHELWRHAAHHRGLREAIGELPGLTLHQRLRQWPRTCGTDVVAIDARADQNSRLWRYSRPGSQSAASASW